MEKFEWNPPGGDGRRRNDPVLWGMIKELMLLPFVDLKTEYYDLGLAASE